MTEGRRRVTSKSVRMLTHNDSNGCGRTLAEHESVLHSDGIVQSYVRIRCRTCKEWVSFQV